MARARSIKPGFFTNEELAKLPPLARILYSGLWTLADREGRLEDRPDRIRVQILPFDRANVNSMLSLLESSGFIVRYTVNEKKFICIPSWRKHQNPHMKEVASTIPAPCSAPCQTGASTGNSGTSPALTLNPEPLTLNPEPVTDAPGTSPDGEDFALSAPDQPSPAKTDTSTNGSLFDKEIEPFDEWFERDFWKPWPKKTAKEKAKMSASKRGADKSLAVRKEIADGLARQLARLTAKYREAPDFFPYPATWLNNGQFNDEYGIAEPKLPEPKVYTKPKVIVSSYFADPPEWEKNPEGSKPS